MIGLEPNTNPLQLP